MKYSLRSARLIVGVSVSLAATATVKAQTLTKLYDFPSAASAALTGAGINPYDSPVLIGDELWFTTQKGGTTGFGSITKYNIVTNKVTTVLDTMDNVTGNTPQSSFSVVGNNLYYTTTRGGTGDRGTIDVYNIASQTNLTLYSSPSQTSGSPYTLPGNVAYVDLGNGSASIYAIEQSGGGASPTAGGIVKLTLDVATQAVTSSSLLYTFPGGASHGRQPWKGIIQVGNNLYFTMATGGPLTTTGAPSGPGGIGVLNLANDSVNDALAFFPNTDGAYAIGFSNPTYDAAHNVLYVGTNGTSTQPGGLLKFDLATNKFTGLYELSPANPVTGLFPDGRYIDGPITQLGDDLFFTTKVPALPSPTAECNNSCSTGPRSWRASPSTRAVCRRRCHSDSSKRNCYTLPAPRDCPEPTRLFPR